MIDCSKTENFIREKERICQHYTDMGCTFCVLDRNIEGLSCSDFIVQQPKKAIEIVQKWSNETPPKTYLSELKKAFPHCRRNRAGMPFFCLKNLGASFTNSCDLEYSPINKKCFDCWTTPIEESEVR